jgi:hypothetical protein
VAKIRASENNAERTIRGFPGEANATYSHH